MMNEKRGPRSDGTRSESVLQAAMAALASNSFGMTQQERVAIALELFRLADTVAVRPSTGVDVEAKLQAERRMAWLLRWLEQAGASVRPTEPGNGP